MIRIESSTQIGRSREEVFDFLTDVERFPQWQSGVLEVKSLTPEAPRMGSQFNESFKVGPWKLRGVGTVTDFRAGERFAFTMKSSGPLDCEVHFDLQPVVGGTRLTISGRARLKGIWRLLQ